MPGLTAQPFAWLVCEDPRRPALAFLLEPVARLGKLPFGCRGAGFRVRVLSLLPYSRATSMGRVRGLRGVEKWPDETLGRPLALTVLDSDRACSNYMIFLSLEA